jgi:hypothetical protein
VAERAQPRFFPARILLDGFDELRPTLPVAPVTSISIFAPVLAPNKHTDARRVNARCAKITRAQLKAAENQTLKQRFYIIVRHIWNPTELNAAATRGD